MEKVLLFKLSLVKGASAITDILLLSTYIAVLAFSGCVGLLFFFLESKQSDSKVSQSQGDLTLTAQYSE